MKNEFIPYKQALALKELGFNEDCFGFYFKKKKEEKFKLIAKGKTGGFFGYQFDAPIYQQAFRWFREKYNLHYRVTYFDPVKAQELNKADYQGVIYYPHREYFKLPKNSYETYEKAELECLKKLIEIVKKRTRNKNKNEKNGV